jgi:hypothetical protein
MTRMEGSEGGAARCVRTAHHAENIRVHRSMLFHATGSTAAPPQAVRRPTGWSRQRGEYHQAVGVTGIVVLP